jgi:hypothetical protein
MVAARLKAVRGARMADAKGLERRRGLLSFLTWAFLLAEVFGHEAPPAFAARAQDEESPAPRHAADDAPPSTERADHALLPLPGEADAAPDQLASTSGGPSPIVGTPAMPEGGWPLPGIESGPLPEPVSSSSGQAHGFGGEDLATAGQAETDAIAGHDDQSFGALTMEVAVDPQGLLHGLSEPLGLVSAMTDVVEDVAGSILDTLSSLTVGLGSLLSLDFGSGGSEASSEAVASGGLLSFEPATMEEAYEIETSKGFTDFGISLGLGQSDASSGLGLTSLSMPPLDLAVLGFETDAAHGHSNASDEFGHKSAVDVLT